MTDLPRIRPATALLGVLLLAGSSWAEIPMLLSLQGRLQYTNGDAVTGVQDLTHRLYASAESGPALWVETDTVSLTSDGVYVTTLGDSSSLDPVDLSQALWVGVTLDEAGGGSEFSPRTPLRATPTALRARVAEGLDATSIQVDSITEKTPGAGVSLGSPLRVSTAASACTSGTVGLLRFEVSSKRLQFCDGTQWREISATYDSDGDGLVDPDEIETHGTDPLDADTDDDGLTDGDEVNVHATDPLDADSDDDGLNDGGEIAAGSDPYDQDSDDDTLLDGPEVLSHGSSPILTDTDSDGLSDPDEVNVHFTDPADPDTDADDLDDGDELSTHLTDPLDADTDSDGLEDGFEVQSSNTDPLDDDSDDDFLIDGDEVFGYFTDPLDPDSDDDGLIDGDEILNSTDPNDPDSDNGGDPDGCEVNVNFTDPLNDADDGTAGPCP